MANLAMLAILRRHRGTFLLVGENELEIVRDIRLSVFLKKGVFHPPLLP
jgi:hypothetical protein